MEQRIGPITPPVHAAGTDPAFVPGLVPPRPADAEEAAAEEAAPEQAAEEQPEERPEAAAPEDVTPDAEEATQETEEKEEAEPEEKEEEEAADGPVFEVSDRRGSITADRTGVTFTLDDQEAEFRWDEIGAVEIDTPRFGRRFTVTVYTATNRWYESEVEAPARSTLKEWTAELDAVLDVYFEDGEAGEEAAEEQEKDESES